MYFVQIFKWQQIKGKGYAFKGVGGNFQFILPLKNKLSPFKEDPFQEGIKYFPNSKMLYLLICIISALH